MEKRISYTIATVADMDIEDNDISSILDAGRAYGTSEILDVRLVNANEPLPDLALGKLQPSDKVKRVQKLTLKDVLKVGAIDSTPIEVSVAGHTIEEYVINEVVYDIVRQSVVISISLA